VAAPTPTEAPKIVSVPRPGAAPVPVSKPTAGPTAAARPAAPVPRPATQAASVKPVTAKAPVKTAAAAPAAETELPPDELVGQIIGNYRIDAKIGEGRQGGIYRAFQHNMNRLVRFYALDRTRSADPDEVSRFLSNASVKANVSHPYILAVYEAGEGSGIYFYTCEYLPCSSLRQLAESGRPISQRAAVQGLKAVCEVLAYYSRENVVHELLSANAVLFTANQQPRLANTAAHSITVSYETADEMRAVGRMFLEALDPASPAPVAGLPELLTALQSPENPYPTWELAAQAVAAILPKAAPVDAHKLDAQERAAIKVIDEAKKRQKRSVILSTIISLTLVLGALVLVYWLVWGKRTYVKDFSEMVRIPAGQFIYQDNVTETLPEFWIDTHEVTIGQYAQFLDWVKQNPNRVAELQHPGAPKGKDHIPKDWADQKEINMPGYYTRAIKWGKYDGSPLDLNSPVFGVDFYDAYAYAKWKGRRLPTEKEWEKAARGVSGNLYPWGNEEDKKAANSGADFDPSPEKGGEIDGWEKWNPVDAKGKDKSPFGVVGMAGNVAEWTSSKAPSASEKLSGVNVPVIRGGHWQNPDIKLTRRATALLDTQNDYRVGFRTASDKKPEEPAK